MKAFVFKSNNLPLGNFSVTSPDQVPDAIAKFGEDHALSAYDYVECAGKTWTLVDRSSGLVLVEGRIPHTPATDPSGNLSAPELQDLITLRYRNSYAAAGRISSTGTVVKFAGIAYIILILFILIIVINDSKSRLISLDVIYGLLAGAAIYLIGVIIYAQGQLLKAALDSAVHTSPFLSDDRKLLVLRQNP